MKPNDGFRPRLPNGTRVRGILANGARFGDEPLGNALPSGWAVETTRWSLTDSPFDVAQYEVAK